MGDVGDFLEGPEFGFVGLSGEFGKLCYVAKSGGVEGTVEHEADPGGRTSFEYVLGSGVVFAEGGHARRRWHRLWGPFGSRGMWLGR